MPSDTLPIFAGYGDTRRFCYVHVKRGKVWCGSHWRSAARRPALGNVSRGHEGCVYGIGGIGEPAPSSASKAVGRQLRALRA